jgi:hypothetical protein
MKKKIFTLFAFLTMFMGANAANWVSVYSIDYSSNTGFPFYVMGYVPEWFDGVMTDFGAMYAYKTDSEMEEYQFKDGESEVGTVTTQAGVTYHKIQLAAGAWHQYFIADGIPTQIDGHYKVKAMAKASEAVTVNVNMGWGWGDGQQAGGSVSIGTEWAEVEWEYSGIAGTSCNLVAQPGGSTATIEWKSVTVYEDQREQRPIEWLELITADGTPEGKWMGDAETPWGDLANTAFNDTDPAVGGGKTTFVSAWSKVNAGDPFPAPIEEVDGSHVFVVHGTACANPDDGASAWDNQFWIMSTKELKVGSQYKVHFRYKASEAAKTNTQMHSSQPSDYLHYAILGDVNFTTEWQEYNNTVTIP